MADQAFMGEDLKAKQASARADYVPVEAPAPKPAKKAAKKKG